MVIFLMISISVFAVNIFVNNSDHDVVIKLSECGKTISHQHNCSKWKYVLLTDR